MGRLEGSNRTSTAYSTRTRAVVGKSYQTRDQQLEEWVVAVEIYLVQGHISVEVNERADKVGNTPAETRRTSTYTEHFNFLYHITRTVMESR